MELIQKIKVGDTVRASKRLINKWESDAFVRSKSCISYWSDCTFKVISIEQGRYYVDRSILCKRIFSRNELELAVGQQLMLFDVNPPYAEVLDELPF